MRHVNINRIITVSFLEDITTTDVHYEDSKGNNMDNLIFKNKISGTRPKSLVVGNIKYHIHYNDPKIDETKIERHPYVSTTGRSTDAMRDKSLLFKLRGRCVNPKKEYMDNSTYFMYPGSIVKEKINMTASYHGSGHHKAEEDKTVQGNLTTNTMKKYMKCLGISFKNIKGDTDGE